MLQQDADRGMAIAFMPGDGEHVPVDRPAAAPGAILHGVGEEAVRVSDVAVAADLAAGGPGRALAWPVAEAAAEIGEQYAASLALDQAISSARTRQALGWTPARPTLVEDLSQGSYVRPAR
ncbi:hypothetical protein [Nonomuraea insulae]|uniref:Uncharacterized protein n=1 Tax=Nonomuraea insulae TaxID=1616787 RepID=A0ABW1CUF5_9ACTN